MIILSKISIYMITETNELQTEQHLFTERDIVLNREASSGQRLLNYIIDNIITNYVIGLGSGFLLGAAVAMISQELAYDMFVTQTSFIGIFGIYMIVIVNYLIYYTFCEKVFNGVTLGKLITGTKAIRQDGLALTWKDAFMRSLCRLVPFEPFSALGNWPWHDRWTNTMVIKTR